MATKIFDGDTDTTYTTAGNWQGGVAPAAADDVIFPDGCANNVAGSDQTGTALTSFTVREGYSGTVGSMTNGLIAPLLIKATTVNLSGSGLSYFDLTDSATSTCNVGGAAYSPGDGLYGLHLSTSDTIDNLNISLESSQSVGVGMIAGNVAEFTTVQVAGAGEVWFGTCATTTLTVSGSGIVHITNMGLTTLNIVGSPTVYIDGIGTIGTILARGGTIMLTGTGTITTLTMFDGCRVDATASSAVRTITNCNRYGGILDDSGKRCTFTNGVDNYGADDGGIKLGGYSTITRTAI